MTQHETESTQAIPRLEPWLIVCLGTFVPMTAAFMVRASLVPYLFCIGAALFVSSMVMLVRQEGRKRR